jgi:AraC-like DNA-binding protein
MIVPLHLWFRDGDIAMAITVRQTIFSDFEALQHVVQDGRSDVVPLGRGKVVGSLTHISVDPSFGVSTGSFSRGVRLQGVTSDSRWMFGMLLATSGEASTVQRKLAAGDLAIFPPGQERYSVYRDSASFSAVFVAPEQLNAFLATQPGAVDSPIWRQRATLRTTDPATAADTIAHLAALSSMLSEYGPQLSDHAAEFYQRNILELLTATALDTSRYRGRRVRSALRLVAEVDGYLVDAGSRPIHISELCEKFDVGRRMLHRAFIDVLGMPPITFLRHKRLGDVHTALLRGGPELFIKDVAIEHGFLDLSRFAGEYRRLFGERPSETHKRFQP